MILGENALDAFPRLDGEALHKVAADVGITPSRDLAAARCWRTTPTSTGEARWGFAPKGLGTRARSD